MKFLTASGAIKSFEHIPVRSLGKFEVNLAGHGVMMGVKNPSQQYKWEYIFT
jgi:hypothetical protein